MAVNPQADHEYQDLQPTEVAAVPDDIEGVWIQDASVWASGRQVSPVPAGDGSRSYVKTVSQTHDVTGGALPVDEGQRDMSPSATEEDDD